MPRRVPPQQVEIYEPSESIKDPSREIWPFAKAQQAVDEGRGEFRNKRRKLILFSRQSSDRFSGSLSIETLRNNPGKALGLSAKAGVRLIERYVNATTSGSDYTATIAAKAWTGRVLPSAALLTHGDQGAA